MNEQAKKSRIEFEIGIYHALLPCVYHHHEMMTIGDEMRQ
jgi:hypothetical protein